MKCVALLKVGNQVLQEWSQFVEWIVAWLALGYVFLVVSQMEKLHNQAKTVTLHHLSVHNMYMYICSLYTLYLQCIYTHNTQYVLTYYLTLVA